MPSSINHCSQMLVVLPVLILSACDSPPVQTNDRFSWNGDCIDAVNSLFIEQSDPSGGAIHLIAQVSATVQDTSFIRCSALTSPGTGGAINCEANHLTCSRCCANECSALSGYVVGIWRPSSPLDLFEDMSFVSCGYNPGDDPATYGSICAGAGMGFEVIRLNATSCFGNSDGCVILTGGVSNSVCRLNYLNVLACHARYSIDRKSVV
jgi:hypothetical protein